MNIPIYAKKISGQNTIGNAIQISGLSLGIYFLRITKYITTNTKIPSNPRIMIALASLVSVGLGFIFPPLFSEITVSPAFPVDFARCCDRNTHEVARHRARQPVHNLLSVPFFSLP
jgi:hypothetical protein